MFIDIYDLYFQHMLLTPYPTNMYYCQYVNILDFVAHFPDDCGVLDHHALLCRVTVLLGVNVSPHLGRTWKPDFATLQMNSWMLPQAMRS